MRVSEKEEMVNVERKLWDDEVLRGYVLLTWTYPCQRPEFLRHVGIGKAQGLAQGTGKGFLWSEHKHWQLIQKLSTTPSSSRKTAACDCSPPETSHWLNLPPGLAVYHDPVSLFCCIKWTCWGCGLPLLVHPHQSAWPTWSLYVCPFFTSMLPQSGL